MSCECKVYLLYMCILINKKLVLTGFVLGNITFLVYKACICDAKMEINSVFLSTVSNKTNTCFLKPFIMNRQIQITKSYLNKICYLLKKFKHTRVDAGYWMH